MIRLYVPLKKAVVAYILRRTTARRMQMLLALLITFAAMGHAYAFQEVDRTLEPIDLARSQTARLSVLNLGNQGEISTARIHVLLTFYDSRGRTLVQSETRLAPGETIHLDLRGAGLPRELGEPVRITAVLRVVPSDPAIGNPNIKTTLELFDSLPAATITTIRSTSDLAG